MPYVASSPESRLGQEVGDGQCVAYVQAVAGAPPTFSWKQGARVRGSALQPGTAIATFTHGAYQNSRATSHAAILIRETPEGLLVYDQWLGQPVHQRFIPFRGGSGKPINDGDAYSVIE